MNFTAKYSRPDAKSPAITIHAAGCRCVSGPNNARTGYQWGLESRTVADALIEVGDAEDCEARGIPMRVADCAKTVTPVT